MQVIHESGYAIDKNVDVVINSANGWLIQDSSGAGKIRELSNPLNENEKALFEHLFEMLPKKVKAFYKEKQKKGDWKPRKANLSSLKLILNYGELKLGDAVIDKEWSKDKKIVIHAITMSYDEKTGKRIQGTELSVQTAIESALRLALPEDAKSIALPIPCARQGYGLTPKKSLEAVLSALYIINETDIKIIVCHDNEDTKKLLESYV
jgi:O-acetyl-ADP-ribose deacetylase (regulator of RNase III)